MFGKVLSKASKGHLLEAKRACVQKQVVKNYNKKSCGNPLLNGEGVGRVISL